MGLGVSGKVPELSFEESAGFFLPGNIVGGGSWKILVGSFIPGKSCVWRGFKSRIKPVRGRPRDWCPSAEERSDVSTRAQCRGQGATPPPMVCGAELGDDHVDLITFS